MADSSDFGAPFERNAEGKLCERTIVSNDITVADSPASTSYFQWIYGDAGATEVIPSDGTATTQWYDVSKLDFSKLAITLVTTLSASIGTNGIVVQGSRDGVSDITPIEVQNAFDAGDTILLDGGLFDINAYPFIRVLITDDSTTAGTVKGFLTARGG